MSLNVFVCVSQYVVNIDRLFWYWLSKRASRLKIPSTKTSLVYSIGYWLLYSSSHRNVLESVFVLTSWRLVCLTRALFLTACCVCVYVCALWSIHSILCFVGLFISLVWFPLSAERRSWEPHKERKNCKTSSLVLCCISTCYTFKLRIIAMLKWIGECYVGC